MSIETGQNKATKKSKAKIDRKGMSRLYYHKPDYAKVF